MLYIFYEPLIFRCLAQVCQIVNTRSSAEWKEWISICKALCLNDGEGKGQQSIKRKSQTWSSKEKISYNELLYVCVHRHTHICVYIYILINEWTLCKIEHESVGKIERSKGEELKVLRKRWFSDKILKHFYIKNWKRDYSIKTRQLEGWTKAQRSKCTELWGDTPLLRM